ncbi:MAG: 4-hydroxybenzoate octaprenyltransferase [Verrucomicrobia bacterium]|nr:MAG: 4-hydroxybenzoate octaprenyltransferase [Verrucomicrobiota bacterium]
MSSLSRFLTFIRFSHTVFALPFALGAMIVSASDTGGWPGWKIFVLIVFCMVFARTAAMTFNRISDWEIDKRNPRTAIRHTLLTKRAAIATCVTSAALFIVMTSFINRICFLLSPLALALIFFYSLTKRFTHTAQFFLGLALSASPVAAWIAVTGSFAWPPLILAAGVLCWVAGFDMIYAMQDVEADAREGLHSMVIRLGIPGALKLAGWLHLIMFIALLGFGLSAHLGRIYFLGLIPIPLLLVYEHRIAGSLDLGKINKAFFETNAVIGFLFVAVVVIDRCFH